MHHHTRRGFLSRTLGAAWTAASTLERAALVAARARAQSTANLPQLFDLEKVADGVYGAIARGRALINSNAAIFENSDHFLIVDAHAAPSAVYSLVAQIRREIGDKPVRYVVTTHVHGDHTQGLPAYRKIAPTADIISSARTRALLAAAAPNRIKSARDSAARSLDSLQARLSAAKDDQERAWCREIAQIRQFVDEMRDVSVEIPNVAFDDHLVLYDKSHELRLSFRGRGHTAGDIVVYCPQKKVIASGDLLHGFFPSMGDAYPRDWPATLRSIAELDFQGVIGGHGGVQRTAARLPQQRAYLEELNELVAKAKQDGVPLDRLQQTVTPASLKSLGGGYGDYLAGEVRLHDFRAALNTPAEIAARGVRDNLASVYRNFDRA